MRMLIALSVAVLIISSWCMCASGIGANKRQQHGDEKKYNQCSNECTCKNSTANCQGQGQKLGAIPPLPSYITDITVTGFTVSKLTENFFEKITQLNVVSLNLSFNLINYVSPNAFKDMISLKNLNLSFNNFTDSNLRDALYSLQGSNLSSLSLNGMNWTGLVPDIFQGLAATNITKLSLSQNWLSELNCSVFANLKTLKNIIMSNNVIYFLHLRGVENITLLDLQENDISRSFIFCGLEKDWNPNIKVLNLRGNHLRFVRKDTFGCMKKLKTLILDNNPITTLVNDMLKGMETLQELHVSYLCHITRIENTAFKSNSLKKLYFKSNNFHFNESSNLMQIFQHFPQLETLDISNNFLKPPLNMRKIFSKLPSLKFMHIGKTRLYYMPENLFMHMKKLSTLIISENRIASWDGPKVFGKIKSIRKLDLAGNYITVVNQTSFPKSLLYSLKKLDLSYNHFSCTCENLWFRDWIRNNKDNIRLIGYPEKYMCKSPKKLSDAGVRFKDYNPTIESCEEEPVWIYAIVSVAALIVFTVFIATILYKCRWNIRYRIYLMRRHRYERIPNDEEYVYAGYIIYSDNDREWVHDELRKHLEDKEGIRLCVRLRDFLGGISIVDNIAENMHLSRKLLIVISNNFAKDEWCKFELSLAQHRCVSGENDLILVMLNEVSSENLSESLHALITTTSYAIWSEEEVGQTLFWEQVTTVMK